MIVAATMGRRIASMRRLLPLRPLMTAGITAGVAVGLLGPAAAAGADPEARELPEGSPAAAGQQVYAIQCASCHGTEGEGFIGPPVMGSGAALEPYANGERLLEYISTTMPQTSPGSLSDSQYRQLLAYLLVRNGFVEPDWSPAEQPPDEVSLQN